MVYSLLSMLGTHDKDDMSRTLLAMSSSQDSCIAMRQSGCLPLLIQLLHGNDKDSLLLGKLVLRESEYWGNILTRLFNCISQLILSSHLLFFSCCPGNSRGSKEARARASAALHNIVHSQPDDKRGRREIRVLHLLEQVRHYCEACWSWQENHERGVDQEDNPSEWCHTDKPVWMAAQQLSLQKTPQYLLSITKYLWILHTITCVRADPEQSTIWWFDSVTLIWLTVSQSHRCYIHIYCCCHVIMQTLQIEGENKNQRLHFLGVHHFDGQGQKIFCRCMFLPVSCFYFLILETQPLLLYLILNIRLITITFDTEKKKTCRQWIHEVTLTLRRETKRDTALVVAFHFNIYKERWFFFLQRQQGAQKRHSHESERCRFTELDAMNLSKFIITLGKQF